MSATSQGCPSGSFLYTVQRGDTLNAVARRFNTTPQRLSELNPDIKGNSLCVGQAVCIPQQCANYPTCRSTNYYVVQRGDTFNKIARRFGVPENRLFYSNMGIRAADLYEGMILCVPISPPMLRAVVEKDVLRLEFFDGNVKEYPCRYSFSTASTKIISKELTLSFGGIKRLSTAIPNLSITNEKGRRSRFDVILSDADADTAFNEIMLGTEVVFK